MSIREYKDKHGRTKYRVAVDVGSTAAGKRDRLTKGAPDLTPPIRQVTKLSNAFGFGGGI
jgi:hypothetical protein